MKHFTVHVPASSGNLGPGFDVLGMALDLYNEVRVSVISSRPGAPKIHVIGEGEKTVARDARNIIYAAAVSVCRHAKRPMPRIEMTCLNRIPLARGLGSSSAAILSGLLIGNKLSGNKFSQHDILSMASEIEGHPDNIAPALLGGVQACAMLDGHVLAIEWPKPKASIVVAVPSFELSTKKARSVVPKNVPMADAIRNLSSVALMPLALRSKPELLTYILNDRWHEPYRSKLIPGFYAVKAAALKAGAYGVTLSGAGPTMLAFSPAQKLAAIGAAMQKEFKKAGVSSRIMKLPVNTKGAFVR